jgi:non-ribosomal peptide synthetase component F/thioesterase domain-containing protein/acyl carrier protein
LQEVDTATQNPGNFSVSQNAAADEVYVFPASLEQHRYWILDQVDAESTASNMAIAFRLEGDVQDNLAEQAICELTLRHEALRTTFRMVNGELLQVISEEPSYGFSVSDVSVLPEEERLAAAEMLIREHSRVHINLATGPVFLTHLIHIDSQHHFLAFTIHHSVCDGWSNGILVRDFADYYGALVSRTEPSLPELPFQFADFTEWQKEWLDTDDARNALVFWKEQIRRNVPALDLPCDRPRSARKDGPGDIESQLISSELNARIKNFCRQHDATMHQVLLATFEAFLARYTGQSEFLLGSSIANRTQAGMEHVVGRFANPQVILANVERDPTFHELLGRVSDWSSQAYAHQDLPFSRLMEEFQLELTGASSQFLQVYFVYQRAFMQPQQASNGLKIIPRPSVSGGVNFDLLVSVVERAEGPRVQIEYNTDLFNKERIRSFIDLYIRAIDATMKDDSLRVSELSLLSAEEESALAKAGRGETPSNKKVSSLAEAFDMHAAQLGERTAIGAGKNRTSWTALRSTSLKYAAALHSRGIQSGQTVALRMEPNASTAAAALAILRAGACVMPIPASTTVEEWNRILADLRPEAALASESFARAFTNILSFEKLHKTDARPSETTYPGVADQAVRILSLDAGENYRITAVSHAAVAEQLKAAADGLRLRSGSTILVFPTETAVDAWTDLLLPLISGASIVYNEEITPAGVDRVIARDQAGFGFGSPHKWLLLLRSGWNPRPAFQVVSRGDRLPVNIAHELAHAGNAWSMLSSAQAGGPVGLIQLLEGSHANWPVAPLPGQRLMVRDQWGNPSPPGVSGELCLGAADQTATQRTGYLARYSPQLGFELIETLERSVRISGYQVRLGELEDRLLSHPDVIMARATVQNGAYGTPELVAYATGIGDHLPAHDSLISHMRTTAPEHLSRAEIVTLQSIPCRLDGAANLSVLPRPDRTKSTRVQAGEIVPPTDELETKLVAIWEEVLGVQGIGIRTSFFSLGGYSLLIVRLFARINKAFGTSLPITTIFNAPTIEQLAEILRGRKAYSALVPVQPGDGIKPPFFLVHSYLLYAGLPSVLGKAYPFYGLRELDDEGEMTIPQRVQSYIKAIRSVQPHGPYYFGGWCAAGPLTVEMARQLTLAGEKVAFMVLFDSWRPGYAEELAAQQASQGKISWFTRNRSKYAFHSRNLRKLSASGKFKYLWAAALHKAKNLRDALYLKHWATARWLSKQIGFELPHFMHNISLDTLNQVAQYKSDPFPCRMVLMRATESQHIPGADLACGWGQIVTEGVEVIWAPGDHESMFKEPNLSVVGKMLSERMEREQRAS